LTFTLESASNKNSLRQQLLNSQTRCESASPATAKAAVGFSSLAEKPSQQPLLSRSTGTERELLKRMNIAFVGMRCQEKSVPEHLVELYSE
jgi:hypothetical protein